MTHHTEVLNYIIEKKGYKSYLEIGTQSGKNFAAIKCEKKTGVDPDPMAVADFYTTSDSFFESAAERYDLVFIDGLHTAEQVKKDFINAMDHLNDGGIICLHDTNPLKEEWTKVPRETKQWTGDVYQLVCCLVGDFITLPFDYGITVIKKYEWISYDRVVSWSKFEKQRNTLLKIIDEEQFKHWL